MFSTATVVVAMTGAVVLCIVAPTFFSITVGIAAEVVFDDDDNDDVPVIGKFTRTEIEQAFGLKHNSLIVPTNDNDNDNNNTAASTTTTTTLFDTLANQNAWTPYENWPLQIDHFNSLLDPATEGGQYMLDIVSKTYTPNIIHLLEGGHEYEEYIFFADDTVFLLHYKVLAYINETDRIVTTLDKNGVPNTNDISNLFLTQFVENCSTPIDSEVHVGWYLIGPNYGPYEGYKGYNGTTSMADPNWNRGRMVVSFMHVDLTASLSMNNTTNTSWSRWILEHRDEYKKPFGEAPICASTMVISDNDNDNDNDNSVPEVSSSSTTRTMVITLSWVVVNSFSISCVF